MHNTNTLSIWKQRIEETIIIIAAGDLVTLHCCRQLYCPLVSPKTAY